MAVLAGALACLLVLGWQLFAAERPVSASPASQTLPHQAAQPPAIQPHATAGPDAITTGASYQIVSSELTYGDQTATVFRPVTTSAHPVAYFVHGGFWLHGGRGQYAREAQAWARNGWVAITLDYPLGVDYTLQLSALAQGVARVEQQPYADPGRQVVLGDSSGGHLAALLATRHARHFRGQILFSPVISPLNAYRDSRGAPKAIRALGEAAQLVVGHDWAAADPSRQVTAATPPLWMASSTADFVPYRHHGLLLARALGDRATVHLVPGLRHGKSLEQGPLLREARAWARAEVRAQAG